MRSALRVPVICLFVGLTGPAYAADKADPLFQSDEILEIRIEAPFREIMRERPVDRDIAASFSYATQEGMMEFDIGIRTRGHSRRKKDICEFAPLRLDFRKSQVKKTLFHKQNKLKLVTHCQNRSSYEQAVLKEYLAYRILNMLTDVSYRARLVRVTYADTGNDKNILRYGILLEHKKRTARRIDKSVISVGGTTVSKLDAEYTNLASVFHLLIGNTDFSPIAGPPGDDCCHNHTLFGNSSGPWFSVPYDFDGSGFVNAPYAKPNPRFNLRSVRDRKYRGRCVNNERLPATLQLFRQHRNDINTLLASQPPLEQKTRKSVQSYVDRFYEDIDDARYVDRKILKACN